MLERGCARDGSLPTNVAFVFEGEEENGSAGFREAIEANLHWFEGTQLIVISNTLWVGEQVGSALQFSEIVPSRCAMMLLDNPLATLRWINV